MLEPKTQSEPRISQQTVMQTEKTGVNQQSWSKGKLRSNTRKTLKNNKTHQCNNNANNALQRTHGCLYWNWKCKASDGDQ